MPVKLLAGTLPDSYVVDDGCASWLCTAGESSSFSLSSKCRTEALIFFFTKLQ